ncbi:FHA domain-containing protein FhaA [Rubripirellula obstinata]|uniref:FHA domain-containing protein FhaA n=2 Tax=Rubripirellula obstinata TaxID=406547 RepID=A0A5B1CJK7_9BACT|nr:FHA domain-containing protein FhaA [Rubripirellula obstinata]
MAGDTLETILPSYDYSLFSWNSPMPGVTLKILHGADRGKVYEELSPPFTVGREEGNDIQLNDERVSRCHFKVQKDNDRLVLTDLESTNGTKVNGVECQLKILRHGDLVAVGRSLMLVGSESEIAARLAAMGTENPTLSRDMSSSEQSLAVEVSAEPDSPVPAEVIQLHEVPSIPDGLSPGQKAQLCEILDYLQSRIHRLIESARTDENNQEVMLKLSAWQRMLDTQSRIATMTRQIADPDWPEE